MCSLAHACSAATPMLITAVQGNISRRFKSLFAQHSPRSPTIAACFCATLALFRLVSPPKLMLAFLGVLAFETETGIAAQPTQGTKSQAAPSASSGGFWGENPAHSCVSRLGTPADAGTPSGCQTGHVWTTPFSSSLFPLEKKKSLSVPVVIPSICLFLLARAPKPNMIWV